MTAAASIAAWHRINWQQVCLHLRRHYKPLAHIAPEVGVSRKHMTRLGTGETLAPSTYEVGLKLLDLHLDHCPELHRQALIMHPQQEQLL